MPLETSAEKPTTVRTVARLIGDWVDRLGAVWVEGQLVQVTRRPGAGMVFLTLRDPSADISVTVTCSRPVLDAVRPPIAEGSRVVVFAKPRYYIARGTLSLSAKEIRPVGEGELLARLAHLRQVLTTEGLFDADRKRPLPFLPRTVGLVCGRASAAEKDVVENARRRWPAVEFAVREVAVQGPYAVAEVLNALRELDADPSVDVIVIARGGGSLEDLLPFSDESLVRTVAAAVTPVVSAIGHERDEPLLDLVADVRASTPTDAARRVVPDVVEELGTVTAHRDRAAALLVRRVTDELQWLATVRTRPSLADPLAAVRVGGGLVADLAERSDRAVRSALDRRQESLTHTSARLRALSPQATLDRGYAIVQRADATIVRSAAQVDPDERLRVRVAEGGFDVTVAASP